MRLNPIHCVAAGVLLPIVASCYLEPAHPQQPAPVPQQPGPQQPGPQQPPYPNQGGWYPPPGQLPPGPPPPATPAPPALAPAAGLPCAGEQDLQCPFAHCIQGRC